MTLKKIVEALVFASPKPLSTKEIVAALKSAGNPEKTDDPVALELAKTKEDAVLPLLGEIQAELEATGRAFQLVEQVNGWSFVTVPSAVHWVRQLYPEAKPTRLTGPQLETLAIIAYRQPVTRADMEAVRGVAVDGVVQVLMERSLIKIAGRADVPGRPLLYETTEYFLQHFGLKTVNELPNATELRRIELPKAEHPEPEAPKEKTKKGKQSGDTAKTEAAAENVPAASTEASAPTEGREAEAAEPAAAESIETESTAEPSPEARVESEPESDSPEPLDEAPDASEAVEEFQDTPEVHDEPSDFSEPPAPEEPASEQSQSTDSPEPTP